MKILTTAVLLMLVVTTVAAAGELKEDLVTLEKGLWKAWGKADGEKFSKQVTEDHVQVVAGLGIVAGRDRRVWGQGYDSSPLQPGETESRAPSLQQRLSDQSHIRKRQA